MPVPHFYAHGERIVKSVYLKAADWLARNAKELTDGCCDAIARVGGDDTDQAAFYDLFKPTEAELLTYRHGSVWWMRAYGEPVEDATHRRIVALCFAAVILDKTPIR